MSDIKKLRQQLHSLTTYEDFTRLDDEAWYTMLWNVLDPVIDARIERQQQAVDALLDEKLPDWAKNVHRPLDL